MKRPKERLSVVTLSLPLAIHVAAAAATSGCAPSEESSVPATATLIDQTGTAISHQLTWANGTYGTSCTSRSGAWSMRISGDAPMDHTPLLVYANDASCTLTLTSLVGERPYTSTPPLVLGASYGSTGAAFVSGDAGGAAFYGYGAVSAPGFVVRIFLSDSPVLLDGGTQGATDGGTDGDAASEEGGSVAVTTTTTTTDISSPDYSLDLGSGMLALALDGQNIVQTVSGYAVLLDGTSTGNGYEVDPGTLPANPTFDQLDLVYRAGSPTPIAGPNPQVPAAAFGLIGVDLTSPVLRTIVIQRAVSGVTSYQAFAITFSHS